MFTFKSQAKSNAKRFLVATCKIEAALVDQYLTQVDGSWGTYLDEEGKPVQSDVVASWHASQAGAADTGASQVLADEVGAEDPTDAEIEESNDAPAASAFGAFAMAQLTAPSNSAAAPQEPARAQREGATPTAGLKIQKDRIEQNGVRRQSAGSVGDKLWALYDTAGADVTLEQAKNLAIAAGLSPTSAAIALYNWRKFHGITSRTAAK